MSDLIDTTEMYLRTIQELVEEGIPVMRARIAERLKQSQPTVSETVARMERAGLVHLESDRHIELTAKGAVLAAQVMRRHRLAERLLTDVIGLEWALVHEEACRWEHVISTDVERRLVEILDHPTFSPYGNPIPALADLGAEPPPESFLTGVRQLADLAADGQEHAAIVRRMGEAVQTWPDVLAALAAIGVRPGARITATMTPQTLYLAAAGGAREVPVEVADHLYVADTA
ncbi:MAG: metal-dependent transcriptional regulator [Propionibacteriaceae bacterium]|jgi:DtxR family Mn-dependent transcriptional regulator|nr:metal-dependent transcriptional regulator [Propionibacteriaceae bacterium]